MADTAEIVLEVKNLDISFRSAGETVHAIRGVNLILRRGETVALVGESGSGKSVTMKAAMGILADNAKINGGSILYRPEPGAEPVDLLTADPAWVRKNIRGRSIAMVFQDPMTSLNPTMTIGAQLVAAIRAHETVSRKEAWDRALNLLAEVGITEPERRMRQYPHEFSGGMRQRIVIAIALSCNPNLLICDEPTTALDVTIQDHILELILSARGWISISSAKRRRSAPSASARCSSGWAFPVIRGSAIPLSFPAASASVWASPAHSS